MINRGQTLDDIKKYVVLFYKKLAERFRVLNSVGISGVLCRGAFKWCFF